MLNLPDSVRGTAVQCPLCQTTFQAPEEEVAPTPRPPAAARPRENQTDVEELDFSTERDDSALGFRHRAALRSASRWLQATVLLEFFGGVGNCCFGISIPRIESEHTGYALVTVFIYFFPLLFIGLGAVQLSQRRSFGLSLTAGILALVMALFFLLACAPAGLHAVHLLSDGRMGGFVFLIAAALMLAGAVSAVVGGVKTLQLLTDPEVKQSFR
jgi:hypothetical protein